MYTRTLTAQTPDNLDREIESVLQDRTAANEDREARGEYPVQVDPMQVHFSTTYDPSVQSMSYSVLLVFAS